MHYDVIIIGAGPSGISAAHNLVNNKISCCLIDKQVFPRNKLCAGGITSKTFELIKSLNLKKMICIIHQKKEVSVLIS